MRKRMTDKQICEFEKLLLEHPPTQHADQIVRVFFELKSERKWKAAQKYAAKHFEKETR